MKIIYGTKFEREYRKLPKDIKELAEKREVMFRKDPYDPRIKTHKLHGRLNGYFSFSIGYKHRIIFELNKEDNIAYFYSVGNHDIYQ